LQRILKQLDAINIKFQMLIIFFVFRKWSKVSLKDDKFFNKNNHLRIVCAVFLLGVVLFCLGRSGGNLTIIQPPITFSPDLSQFPLAIENYNLNKNIEMEIVQEEGTEDILDKNINWEVPIEIPKTVQEQNGDISSDKEYFDGVMDELTDFTRR
jgi:hypothetical protein